MSVRKLREQKISRVGGAGAAAAAEGGAITHTWVDWIPELRQGVAITATIEHAKYLVVGPVTFVKVSLSITSGGTASNDIEIVNLPVPLQSLGIDIAGAVIEDPVLGVGHYHDSGTGAKSIIVVASATDVWKFADADDFAYMQSPTVASGDDLHFEGTIHNSTGGDIGLLGSTFSPILDHKATIDTPDDEFDAATLDAKWTVVTGASGTVDLLETGNVSKYDLATRPGWLLLQVGNDGSEEVSIRQDYTLPDGESIVLAIAPAFTMPVESGLPENAWKIGISLNDSDTTYDTAEYQFLAMEGDVDGWRIVLRDDGVNRGSTPQGEAGPGMAELIYLRMTRSGLDINCFFSIDGTVWNPLGPTVTRAGAADNIWIFNENQASLGGFTPIMAVSWIRQGSNALDPWGHTGLIKLDSVPGWMTYLQKPDGVSHAYDDEFDGAVLSPDWTEVNITAGPQTNTVERGLLSMKVEGGAVADFQGLLKPLDSLSFPLTIEGAFRLFGTNAGGTTMMGIGFSDGVIAASNLMFARTWSTVGTVGSMHGTLTAVDSANTTMGTRGGNNVSSHIYFRVVWRSANTFAILVSPDGVTYDDWGLGDVSKTMTPTHFGIACLNWGAADPSFGAYEYFRVYEADLSV